MVNEQAPKTYDAKALHMYAALRKKNVVTRELVVHDHDWPG